MGKYAPIRNYLQKSKSEIVPMSFAEIEKVLGFKLPASKAFPAWWSNNATNNVMTNEWLAAGYRTEQVDIERKKLVFRRVAALHSDAGRSVDSADAETRRRHPAFGALKDVTWIAPDLDLTVPPDPEVADILDDPKWHP